VIDVEAKDVNRSPIRLVDTNVITRKGYYDCEVAGFSYKRHADRPLLVVDFKVVKGRCEGFQVSAGFYYQEMKGRVRLSHLCGAVGITGQLDGPERLVGKRLRLRVLPRLAERGGRVYRNYLVTRFHGLMK
jgi:hypothetical protein